MNEGTKKVNFSPKNCFFGRTFPFPCLSYGPINYFQVIFSSVSQTLYPWSTPYSSILSTSALWSLILFLLSTCQPSDGHFYSRLRPRNISTNKFTLPPSQLITFPYWFPYVSVCLMSYDVWLFAPTYACISTKLSLYWVNKALSLHNILVFSFHAYRTRQMSMNGGTKNYFFFPKNNSVPRISLIFTYIEDKNISFTKQEKHRYVIDLLFSELS